MTLLGEWDLMKVSLTRWVLCDAVDGDPVPVPHFGLALTVDQFHELAERLQDAGIDFILEPHLRFKGEALSIRFPFTAGISREAEFSVIDAHAVSLYDILKCLLSAHALQAENIL